MREMVKLFYACPECDRKIERLVEFLDPSLFKSGEALQAHAFWCVNCDARQEAKFVVNRKDNGFAVSTISLASNDKKTNKKLKIAK